VHDDSGEILGMIGEFKAEASKKLKLPDYIAGFEIDTEAIAKKTSKPTYVASSKFPRIEQDISLKVASNISYAQLSECLQRSLDTKKPEGSITKLSPLDIYVSENESSKNMSFRLTISSHQGTLRSADVNALLDAVAENAATELGATRV
jgi:phenylalanyl-tRNA synthetase beta subunit